MSASSSARASNPFPKIIGITKAPMFDPQGNLRTDAGYCAETMHWNDFKKHVEAIKKPTPEQVRDAREFLLKELLGDFPFADQASTAGAVEFMLRPFARLMINGPTPMTLIHAPAERVGKGLLVEALTIPFLGQGAPVSSMPAEEEEVRKRITSCLTTGDPIFVLDNLPDRRVVDSHSLAVMLTDTTWQDRILGQTKLTTMPALACWAATGNNPRLSSELCGRVVSVRLVSLDEDPSQRKGFRHPLLATWAKDHRWTLVDCCLTLIAAWVSQGKPEGLQTLGRYESWASVMGGILDVAGIPGLLDNMGR